MNIKTIKQSTLTADCLLIQMFGLESCDKCKVKNTKDCGGGKTLKALKNEYKNQKADKKGKA
jgi:hypothetical protein